MFGPAVLHSKISDGDYVTFSIHGWKVACSLLLTSYVWVLLGIGWASVGGSALAAVFLGGGGVLEQVIPICSFSECLWVLPRFARVYCQGLHVCVARLQW